MRKTLKFNIDKKLSELFAFVVSYMNDDKTNLFQQWKEASFSPSSSVSESSDTVLVEFAVDEKTEIEFNFALKTLWKGVKPSIWLEQNIRRYCVTQLDQIRSELKLSNAHLLPSILPRHTEEGKGEKDLTPQEEHNAYVVGYVHARDWSRCLYPNIWHEGARLAESARRLSLRPKVFQAGIRDRFDRRISEEIDPNHSRVGWDRPLPDKMQSFWEEYKTKDQSETIEEAKQILGL